MKRFTNGKLAALLLAVALTFAVSAAALADWPSFQNDPVTNNGVVTVAPPTATPTSVVRVGLTTNDPPELNPPDPPYPSSVFTGIDTESVIGGGYVYTVYNGGVSGPTGSGIGGSRLGITNLQTGVSNNVQLDSRADNISQLSTPCYIQYESAGELFALSTRKDGSRFEWILYWVDNPSAPSPNPTVLKTGTGQASTPITAYTDPSNGDLYLYFGTWSANNSSYQALGQGQYHQHNVNTGQLRSFSPGNDDFYNAGAAIVTIGGTPYIVFGSDGYGTNPAKVYVRPFGANFASSSHGNSIQMSGAFPNDKIRSSMAYDATSQALYFTSRYIDSEVDPPVYTGEIWKLPVSNLLTSGGTLATLANYVTLPNASTSTPVISPNGYVYVGHYKYDPDFVGSGGVVAVQRGFTTGASLINIYGNPSVNPPTGDPVQASPIVYSDEGDDYIYFTTNSGTGKGYCYRYDGNTPASIWSAGGTSANPYAEQGFASDNGYLVYGDDSNNLYIMH